MTMQLCLYLCPRHSKKTKARVTELLATGFEFCAVEGCNEHARTKVIIEPSGYKQIKSAH